MLGRHGDQRVGGFRRLVVVSEVHTHVAFEGERLSETLAADEAAERSDAGVNYHVIGEVM